MTRKVTELTEVQRARFDKCWSVYPRKVNKGEAEIAWGQIDPDEELTTKIYDAILAQNKERGSKFLSKDQKKFIKHFSSWLRAKGWVFEFERDGELASDEVRKCKCGGERVFEDLCIKCYEETIRPQIPLSLAEQKFEQRLNKITDWIQKKNHQTKREACLDLLRKKGMLTNLPEHLR